MIFFILKINEAVVKSINSIILSQYIYVFICGVFLFFFMIILNIYNTADWLTTIIIGGCGLCITLFGGMQFLTMRERFLRNTRLLKEGVLLEVQIKDIKWSGRVIELSSKSFSGVKEKFYVKLYRIKCEWLEKKTNKLFVFYSEYIPYDPSPHIQGKTINVYIDKNTPKKYYVDISFLPK